MSGGSPIDHARANGYDTAEQDARKRARRGQIDRRIVECVIAAHEARVAGEYPTESQLNQEVYLLICEIKGRKPVLSSDI